MAEAARQKTLESLEHAVTSELTSKEETERYAAAVQRAVEWAAAEIEADKGRSRGVEHARDQANVRDQTSLLTRGEVAPATRASH